MTDLGYAAEVEVLANERFAAVGGALGVVPSEPTRALFQELLTRSG